MNLALRSPRRSGFTLIEVMVSTAIMVVIILAVVTMASSTFKAYDRAVADLTTQSEARGVLDALENDFQTAVIRPDGRCWMEIILPGATGAPVNAPKNVGNLRPEDQPMIMLFASPPDRPRWSPVPSVPRVALKGDVCAVCYRFGQRSPFDNPGDPIQQIYGVYRTIIDAQDTFAEALPVIYSSTTANPKSPWDYWASVSRTVPNYNASSTGGAFQSRVLVDANAVSPTCWTLDLQNFLGSNVVSMQLVLWCSSSLPAKATSPALADPLQRTPDTLRPVICGSPVGSSDNFKFGTSTYGGFNAVYSLGTAPLGSSLAAPQRYSPTAVTLPVSTPGTIHPYDIFGARLRVYSDRMYPDSLGPTSVAPTGQLPYLPYTIKAVEVCVTVLTPEGAKELRALQKLTATNTTSGTALVSVNDYKRIVNQYGRNYTRYIRLLSLGG